MKIFNMLILAAVGWPVVAAGQELVLPRQADGRTSTVDLTATRGKPEHIASSSIYGIPDNFPNQIPSRWYVDMGWRWGKGGGAQLRDYGGWFTGTKGYQGRFESTLANYNTCRAVGADFHIYVHDLWGTDHANQNSAWPGDGGDWRDYDKFVKQLMTDIAAQMDPAYVTWDIWNEPDISIFWRRSTQQWVDLYIRTHKLIRSNPALNALRISGPSLAYRPKESNAYWTAWLSQIAGNKTVPDYYAYHLEGGLRDADNDPQYTNVSLAQLLRKYGLPERQVFINEYASSQEQVPGGYIWWISRLERYDFFGMLGNWLGGLQLHDLFGGLLTKTRNRGDYKAVDYAAAPGYPIYRYYNQNMTGLRATTAGSTDRWFDTYATVGDDKVRILAGVKVNSGTWNVKVQGLSVVGYKSGTVSVTKLSFGGSSIQQVAGDIVNKGTETYTIAGDSITIPVVQANNFSGWALEFPVWHEKSA